MKLIFVVIAIILVMATTVFPGADAGYYYGEITNKVYPRSDHIKCVNENNGSCLYMN